MAKKNAYLFVHFIGEQKDGEQIYFSLSKDGFHWEDVNQGKPVLYSKMCEEGVRDPFIIYSPIDEHYYIIATDLCIYKGKGWQVAQYEGSRNIILWKSKDLLHWGEPWVVEIGIPSAGCVWAPEAIYDQKNDNFLVFFASMVKEEEDLVPKQRIYAVRTKDFKSYSTVEKYIERENHVIDTTMIYSEGKYYRFSKDETTKKILFEMSDTLDCDGFITLSSTTLDNLYGVEGPQIFAIDGEDKGYCLIVDRFAEGKGYLPLFTRALQEDFRILHENEYDMGSTKKRHGSVIAITQEEYKNIKELIK
ncbi:MAG: glycoside hydrolase family 43 protein [Vallitaleaceae bacterium]|nr:glycoside hydrolase family 43 protein [Vallitaleaceae bacterium]